MKEKKSTFRIFWVVLAIIGLVFLTLSVYTKAFGAKLPDEAAIDYYDLSNYQLLKLEEFPAISWVRIASVVTREESEPEKPHEKIILITDIREYRIIVIYHQKTDGKNIEMIGCHADLDFLDTLGQKEPDWITFPDHCQEEISNFLHIFGKIYQKERMKKMISGEY